MKKSLIITIAAALLLAAVLCTAGCVEAPSDPIVGSWVAETDTSVSYAVFENDGTGYFAAAAETEDAAGMLQGTFDWTAAEPGKTYTLTFADGTAKTAALDTARGILTIDGIRFEKQTSELSGAMGLKQYELGERGKERSGTNPSHPGDDSLKA